MPMKKGSKQQPMKYKYAIQNKVKAHHKKLKRMAKKSGLVHKKKDKPIELTIPKGWIHKEAMLKEILESRKTEEERRTEYRQKLNKKKADKRKGIVEGEEKADSDEEI